MLMYPPGRPFVVTHGEPRAGVFGSPSLPQFDELPGQDSVRSDWQAFLAERPERALNSASFGTRHSAPIGAYVAATCRITRSARHGSRITERRTCDTPTAVENPTLTNDTEP
jgi:hypothetical protein